MLAQHLHQLLARHPEFEAMARSVNVTTFRYVPLDLRPHVGSESVERYLDELNQDLLTAVEKRSGEAFLSNALSAEFSASVHREFPYISAGPFRCCPFGQRSRPNE